MGHLSSEGGSFTEGGNRKSKGKYQKAKGKNIGMSLFPIFGLPMVICHCPSFKATRFFDF